MLLDVFTYPLINNNSQSIDIGFKKKYFFFRGKQIYASLFEKKNNRL